MNPETSTRENPIKAHLIKTLEIIGLRLTIKKTSDRNFIKTGNKE